MDQEYDEFIAERMEEMRQEGALLDEEISAEEREAYEAGVEPLPTLPGLLRQLAAVRTAQAGMEAELKTRREEWERDSIVASIIASVAAGKDLLAELEGQVRELAVAAYHETGSKKPAPGVGIRLMTRLEYDPQEALFYALEHQLVSMLKLNAKVFEKAAPALDFDWVTTTDEVQATIATDIVKALEEGESQDGSRTERDAGPLRDRQHVHGTTEGGLS